jgi:hypothetical protein
LFGNSPVIRKSYLAQSALRIWRKHTQKYSGRNKYDCGLSAEEISGLNLARVIQGKDATVIINRMHGKTLDDCENIIAHYGSTDAKNILYLSVYENPEKAKTSLMKMAMKMAAGSTVFKPLTHGKMGAGVHFETEGMGCKHYFYRVDNILIWWQVKPDMAAATFHDLIKFDFTDLNRRNNK